MISAYGLADGRRTRQGRGVEQPSMASPPRDEKNPLLTARDIADEAQVSLRTVRRLIAEGELEIVQVGRSVRIRRSAYLAFLHRRRRRRGR